MLDGQGLNGPTYSSRHDGSEQYDQAEDLLVL